jgi:phosphoribosylformylglycinamidine synthase
MAEHLGADVELAAIPLKYHGLAAWEIWLSEAQERMVLAVAPDRLGTVHHLADRHGVELTVLGTFTGDGILRVRSGGAIALELPTSFLHDGRPRRRLTAELPRPRRDPVPPMPTATPEELAAALLALLEHPDIASKADVIRGYDHEIRGATLVRPLLGRHRDAPADATVIAEPHRSTGLAIGIGVNPWMGVLDPERMARAVVDEAIRNVVAVGADPDRVALMDNFSWGDPRRPTTLGDLVAAVRGCCDAAAAHRAPFVSGKDSLNNEYTGVDGVRRSVPPTLVVTAVAPVPDADRVVTPELCAVGDVVILAGRTSAEFGGSHLALVEPRRFGVPARDLDEVVPAPDPDAPARYRTLHELTRAGLVRSCHDVSDGGLAVALAEMALAGDLGVRVDVAALDRVAPADPITAMFAESIGRLVIAVRPDDAETALAALGPTGAVMLGVTTDDATVVLGEVVVPIEEIRRAFTNPTARGAAQ